VNVPLRKAGARLPLFVLAVAVLGAAFAALVRYQSVHSPLGVVAVLAVELAAIALAVAFHLVELPGAPPRAPGRPERTRVDVDYF